MDEWQVSKCKRCVGGGSNIKERVKIEVVCSVSKTEVVRGSTTVFVSTARMTRMFAVIATGRECVLRDVFVLYQLGFQTCGLMLHCASLQA